MVSKKNDNSMVNYAGKLAIAALLGIAAPAGALAQGVTPDFKGEELVVQTLTGSAGRFFEKEIAKDFEGKYNAEIVMVQSLTSDMVAKMRANAGYQQDADVWMGVETGAVILDKEHLVEPMTEGGVPNLTKVIPGARKKGDGFVNFVLASMCIAYNTEKLKTTDLPKSWTDLADPKYKGRLLLPAANSVFATTLMTKYADSPGWNYDSIDPAIAALKKVTPNVLTYWTGYDQLFNLMNSGQAWLAVTAADRVIDQALKGAPVACAYPEEGTVFIANSVGISKGTKHKKLAEAFVNHLLSDEVQKRMSDVLGMGPVVEGVNLTPQVKAMLPQAKAAAQSTSPDWEKIAARQAQWTDRYVREVVGNR